VCGLRVWVCGFKVWVPRKGASKMVRTYAWLQTASNADPRVTSKAKMTPALWAGERARDAAVVSSQTTCVTPPAAKS